MADILLGILESDPAPLPGADPEKSARYADVLLLPDDGTVSARVANLGQGPGRGVFSPPRAGDEVLVLVPSLDRQAAVILGGFGNEGGSPHPADATLDRVLVTHDQGVRVQVEGGGQLSVTPASVEIRASADAAPEPVVLESLLADLRAYVQAIDTFLLAASTATVAPQVAAAALTAIQTIELAQFGTKLSTSYRAPNVKAGG